MHGGAAASPSSYTLATLALRVTVPTSFLSNRNVVQFCKYRDQTPSSLQSPWQIITLYHRIKFISSKSPIIYCLYECQLHRDAKLSVPSMCTSVPSLISREISKKILLTHCTNLIHQRGYVIDSEKKATSKKPSGFRKYWMSRYIDYIKNYEITLDKKFPTTMHVYRVFSIGSRDFYSEFKKYISVRKKQRKNGLENLSREELQVWQTFPDDLIKISPLFIISALPLTNYIIFPMALLFPQTLLTSHFWSLEQRFKFMAYSQKQRLRRNKPLLRCMQSQLESIRNPLLRVKWSGVIACLGSGTHPAPSEILSCIELFIGPPYSLDSLTRKHMKEMLAIHGMRRWTPNRKRRLLDRGMLIKHMDNSIKREGGVRKLSNDAIRWALSFRGVNPVNMSRESMQTWLENWLLISSHVEEPSVSLLLHSPILLAYNYPTNWTLLYH